LQQTYIEVEALQVNTKNINLQLLKVENEKEGKGIDDLKLKAFSCNVIVIVSVPFNIEPDLL
jgi:hypothetical protein